MIMSLKSSYPDIPPYAETNCHHILLDRPEQRNWPDYPLHIDAITGRKRTFREFLQRVKDAATVFGSEVSRGGLGMKAEDREIVGILSENCLVC